MKHGCYWSTVFFYILNASNFWESPQLRNFPSLLVESFCYVSMAGITVTDVGSNSGVLGRSGSGGLGGAAAGFGSSFFFGAIVDGFQETKGEHQQERGVKRTASGESASLSTVRRYLHPASRGQPDGQQ